MRTSPLIFLTAIAALSLTANCQQLLKLEKTIPVSGMTGGFDHLAYDPATGRIFATAEDQGKVYAFALNSGTKLASIEGFAKPHSVLALPGAPSVLVIDSEQSKSAFLNAGSLKRMQNLSLALGANCLLYDSNSKRAFITAGGDRVGMKTSQVVAIEPATGRTIKSVDVNALHLQPMALDTAGRRLFVSIADHKSIGVFDEESLRMLAEWKLGPEKHHHAPIAFDAEHHSLFVAIDHPGELVVISTQTGKPVASVKIPDDADDLDFDPASHRLFIPCGSGFLIVLDASDPQHVRVLQKLATGKEAATGTWLAREKKYLLGIPQSGSMSSPEIGVFAMR